LFWGGRGTLLIDFTVDISSIINTMNIENVGKYIGEEHKKQVTKGIHIFMIVIVAVTIIISCIIFFSQKELINNIENPKELLQAILVCATALMGLTGLILVEIKKSNIPESADSFEQIKALNTIIDLLRADIVLRWSLLLSFVAIISSCLRLIDSNTLCMTISIASFFDQLVFFLYGLFFSHYLPGYTA
jgi:Na+-driven multidrug efflux pump